MFLWGVFKMSLGSGCYLLLKAAVVKWFEGLMCGLVFLLFVISIVAVYGYALGSSVW